ncbi:guanine nucleotide exchange factor DBS isoform X6 [Platichthys flesus]|uniref:guanine nucleotide exchange factor DBS isoform X6 n=1 Tax=Platichthys flesus TaxID=8260 RepID=UPI002DBA56D8|nr:guanine nucleotide exchange factor DBS isoform X6 [Platichthys flesus]
MWCYMVLLVHLGGTCMSVADFHRRREGPRKEVWYNHSTNFDRRVCVFICTGEIERAFGNTNEESGMRRVRFFSLVEDMKTAREEEESRRRDERKGGKQGFGGERLVSISLNEMESYYRYALCCQQLYNDIMHREDGPLCAAEIGSELQKQFAILPGGRGLNGRPIMVFPEFPEFSELEEDELQSVLGYLSSVPSGAASGVGFILVIDRRLDRWAAVRATLLRIAGSFPGNLHLVLVLRPTTLLQRTLSDFLFKFSREEFKMKVVMLSSVTELHAYIDPGQLTTELGGTQEYHHESWISHRTAIEAFALMVKTTAQTLQAFGTELAETELPNDAEATTNLLHTHALKKDTMKEDLQVALSQGGRLLDCINEPLQTDPEYSMTHDELENLETVQRLLGQLDETETAFDDFWEHHRTKLEQCLQLRHFEQHFREVRAQLDVTSERLSGFSEVSVSPAHGEHVLRELAGHEEKACDVLDRAVSLACEGDRLIENSHYAEDSIRPKCSELRGVCDEISATLRCKKNLLLRAMEMHHSLEKASQWCEEGIFLLANQPVDRCQSQDGAEAALQELERYLETLPLHTLSDRSALCCQYESVLTTQLRDQVERVFQKQGSVQEMFEKRRISLKKLAAKQTRPVQPVAPRPEVKSPHSSPNQQRKERRYSADNALCKKVESPLLNGTRHASLSEEEENLAVLRRHVMNELLETERAYVEELLCVLEGYAAEMDNPAMAPLIPSTLLSKKDVLFGNMSEIYQFHKRTFLKELEAYTDFPELVGRCFLERMKDLQIYEAYCQNKPRSESLWRQCSDCAFFQECQKKLEHKLGLDSYLLKPVQRITKYQLLLKELLKYSKGCDGCDDLQEALSSILGILKAVNDSMHLIAITGYEGNLSELGRLLMQGSFSVWTEHKKGHAKVKDLARFKPMQRHLFLHEKALLFCKRREENGEGYEKAPSYSFKHSLSMSAVGITESAKGDNKKFEVWCNSRDEVFIVQAATPEIKTSWVNEIRKVLTQQLKACRDARQPKILDPVSMSPTSSSSSISLSPFRSSGQKNQKKQDEKKAEPSPTSDANFSSSPKHKDEPVTSPTTDRSSTAKKRFTLQGFSNLKSPKGSPLSPEHGTKRHLVKSDPTPFGFKVPAAHVTLSRVKWMSTSSLLQSKRQGWSKTSLSVDASEENDGYSSGEDPINSDPEDDGGKKLAPGKYTVVADCEKAGPQELSVKSGDVVQLIREGEDGQWFVRNLRSSKEGWVAAANLLSLISESKSSQSLSSSDGSVSGNISTSSSCSETYTSFSDIKP